MLNKFTNIYPCSLTICFQVLLRVKGNCQYASPSCGLRNGCRQYGVEAFVGRVSLITVADACRLCWQNDTYSPLDDLPEQQQQQHPVLIVYSGKRCRAVVVLLPAGHVLRGNSLEPSLECKRAETERRGAGQVDPSQGQRSRTFSTHRRLLGIHGSHAHDKRTHETLLSKARFMVTKPNFHSSSFI